MYIRLVSQAEGIILCAAGLAGAGVALNRKVAYQTSRYVLNAILAWPPSENDRSKYYMCPRRARRAQRLSYFRIRRTRSLQYTGRRKAGRFSLHLQYLHGQERTLKYLTSPCLGQLLCVCPCSFSSGRCVRF